MRKLMLFMTGIALLLSLTSCAGGASGGSDAGTGSVMLSVGTGMDVSHRKEPHSLQTAHSVSIS